MATGAVRDKRPPRPDAAELVPRQGTASVSPKKRTHWGDRSKGRKDRSRSPPDAGACLGDVMPETAVGGKTDFAAAPSRGLGCAGGPRPTVGTVGLVTLINVCKLDGPSLLTVQAQDEVSAMLPNASLSGACPSRIAQIGRRLASTVERVSTTPDVAFGPVGSRASDH